MDPERAHGLAIRALRLGLAGGAPAIPLHGVDPGISLWGLKFPHPVGLAAGFDKNAQTMAPFHKLGCGFVEVGTITPRPQKGNPRPRLFRLPHDRALINRMGFNNDGAEVCARRLARFRARSRGRGGIVGINLGRNKDSADAVADYAAGTGKLAPLADYLVINISSPNTPGLRDLQRPDRLLPLLEAVIEARDNAVPAGRRPPPVLIKLAPELDAADQDGLAELAMGGMIDGLIITNSTVARPGGLHDRVLAAESGGLSGRPLFSVATAMLRRFYRLTRGQVPLIGVGGIMNGADAYAKIRAGASLVQIYTALVYDGPGRFAGIAGELAAHLARDGFSRAADAVGVDADAA